MNNYNMFFYSRLNESAKHKEGNEDAFLALGSIKVLDDTLKALVDVPTKDFIKVVNDAMFKIQSEYDFFYDYLKHSKVMYIPTYPSSMGINTMAVDEKKNLWMNAHFIYNDCKMNTDRIFGILFHELMHNLMDHQRREREMYPVITKPLHMKANICQDFEVNASMVDDGIVDEKFWERMHGMYKKEYTGKRWEDIAIEHGDEEYENWLALSGIKLDEETKAILKAIEEAMKVLRDPDATDAEKKIAGEKLKEKMEELYGKKDKKKSVDKANLLGLKKELEKLLETQLEDMGDIPSKIINLADDLNKNPKDMTDSELAQTVSDLKSFKDELLKNAEKIEEVFDKDIDDVKRDIKKAVKSIAAALNTLHENTADIREERKIIRQAKDDIEGIIMSETDKARREEKRKKAIEEHKKKKEEEKKEKAKKMAKKKEKAAKAKEKLEKRNPIKKFVDTFKNLAELYEVGRISLFTKDILDTIIMELDELSKKGISEITSSDIKTTIENLGKLKKSFLDDLDKLIKDRVIRTKSYEYMEEFIEEVFKPLVRFFNIIVDDSEPSSVKFGAMSESVSQLRMLGKLLKTQRKFKPSEEWIKARKEERARLIGIYKKLGKDALKKELKSMGYSTEE